MIVKARGDVSVVIPVYNSGDLVIRSVESALEQPEVGEVVVVDDQSTDDTGRYLERIARIAGVRLLSHPGGKNRGPSASRNLGILAARRPVIAFLDADDYYLPGRFREAVKLLERSEVGGVHEAVIARFEDNQALAKWRTKTMSTVYGVRVPVAPERLFEALLSGECGHFHTGAITIRRDAFLRTGLFSEEFPLAQDSLMWLKLAATTDLYAGELGRPVSVRYIHKNNRCFVPAIEKHRLQMKVLSELIRSAQALQLSSARRKLLASRVLESCLWGR
ncbi:glycosyltransferase family 2 protein [Achromobacter arsenitoxydans]|uniref:Family 2 glycosyl transferase n=1 Tax=Achromobacter arsenitoxydans SY8 TaxID=477184 RepID=H0FB77_9BURK|nr:family 2 glycosyl transferase [Achromobacter arsenitoxydans SY8]